MVSTLWGNHHVNNCHSQSPPSEPHLRHRKSTRKLPPKCSPGAGKDTRVKYIYTEETLQQALHEIKNGMLDRKRAVKKYGILYTTIVGRLRGRQERCAAHTSQQVLSSIQEEVLCSWVEFYFAQGCPVGISQIHIIAQDIAGATKPPHCDWVCHFLKHHPELVMGKPSGLDPKRAQSFNEEEVRRHFKELEEKLVMLGIPIIKYL